MEKLGREHRNIKAEGLTSHTASIKQCRDVEDCGPAWTLQYEENPERLAGPQWTWPHSRTAALSLCAHSAAVAQTGDGTATFISCVGN